MDSWLDERMNKKNLNWFAWLHNSKSERTWLLKCNEMIFFNSATDWERKRKKTPKTLNFYFKPLIKSVEKKIHNDNKKKKTGNINITIKIFIICLLNILHVTTNTRRSLQRNKKICLFCLVCLCERKIIHYLFEF